MSTQKGPQTDKDQERIAKTIPSIENDELANDFNMNSLLALNYRKIEMSEFYRKFLKENKTLTDADEAWFNFKMSTPLLSDNVLNKETGLPMFYYEFSKLAKKKNPNATKAQITEAWRGIAGG